VSLETVSELVFVTGGARSGKSAFALTRAQECGGDQVSFVATAQVLDDEMRDRIARHRQERNSKWQTLEEPLELARGVSGAAHETVIVDCLSLWVSNLMMHGLEESVILERAEDVLSDVGKKTLIVVTNEVGFGIVPDNALARAYRDALGRVNQRFAAASSEAHLMVSGLSWRLK
jgi:adenosylcobinamide kinase / adenosylcobinamide-phosphate guanylyltransferase